MNEENNNWNKTPFPSIKVWVPLYHFSVIDYPPLPFLKTFVHLIITIYAYKYTYKSKNKLRNNAIIFVHTHKKKFKFFTSNSFSKTDLIFVNYHLLLFSSFFVHVQLFLCIKIQKERH